MPLPRVSGKTHSVDRLPAPPLSTDMIDILDTVVGTIVIIDVYVLIFFRLLVRRDHERHTGQRESTFGAIFSVPERDHLSPSGRRDRRRYWVSLGILLGCLVYVAATHWSMAGFGWPH